VWAPDPIADGSRAATTIEPTSGQDIRSLRRQGERALEVLDLPGGLPLVVSVEKRKDDQPDRNQQVEEEDANEDQGQTFHGFTVRRKAPRVHSPSVHLFGCPSGPSSGPVFVSP